MTSMLQLALPGAVGHQVTATTPQELPGTAAGTDALEISFFEVFTEAKVHHLAHAVGAKLGRTFYLLLIAFNR